MSSEAIQAEQPEAGDPADTVGYGCGSGADVDVPQRLWVDHLETDHDEGAEQESGTDHVDRHQQVAQDGDVSADHRIATFVNEEGWRPAATQGVWLRRNVEHPDDRGSFTELWRASLTLPFTDQPMVQANLSRSRAGVLRGMHFHLHQADLWLLVEGRAVAALTDVRQALSGGRATSEIVEMSVGDALLIPHQVAHGFLALTDMALVYLVSNEYDGSDEHGFAWDDPDAAIDWPAAPRIISDRDRANPRLSELIATFRQREQIDGR